MPCFKLAHIAHRALPPGRRYVRGKGPATMTRKKLAAIIAAMTDEQQDMDVTVCIGDGEYYAAEYSTADTDGVLDDDHPFLAI